MDKLPKDVKNGGKGGHNGHGRGEADHHNGYNILLIQPEEKM